MKDAKYVSLSDGIDRGFGAEEAVVVVVEAEAVVIIEEELVVSVERELSNVELSRGRRRLEAVVSVWRLSGRVEANTPLPPRRLKVRYWK